jgi:transcription antitermination factor NusA-like protein
MNLTYRQLILLTVATTLMYDEVTKTSTPEMKQELMELSKIIQDEAIKVK